MQRSDGDSLENVLTRFYNTTLELFRLQLFLLLVHQQNLHGWICNCSIAVSCRLRQNVAVVGRANRKAEKIRPL